ncbi:hypothetical protein GCM10027019_28300 [Melaminivora jejuensis]|uniref:hypothetical protein n=1 Tax=Melaminivora jejuensis TaxID=1267217 RepID=UPI001ADF2B79|nr:hypothetical protein [Melaminivora jejuensis]UHJ63506.1 hypothetical protein LVC68_08605 [Melaminivora jejuensis]
MKDCTNHQEDSSSGQYSEADVATGCITLAKALVQLNVQLGKTLLLEVMYAENFPDYGVLQKTLLAEHLKTDRLRLQLLDLRIKAALDLATRVKVLFRQAPDAHVLNEEVVQLLLTDMERVGFHWKGQISLDRWAADTDAIVRQWQRERRTLEARISEKQETSELMALQQEIVEVLTLGANHLHTHLSAMESTDPCKAQILEGLEVNARKPLTTSWQWMFSNSDFQEFVQQSC